LWGTVCHHVKREASQLHPIYALQKAQAVCERAGLEPDALVVLPFLN
jgi:hypothetical protein